MPNEKSAIEKLAQKWRELAKGSDYSWFYRDRADEVMALAPEIEAEARAASQNLLEVVKSQDRELERMRSEIAALRERMECGHPKACWENVRFNVTPESYEFRAICTACEHERLAVASALREAAEHIRPFKDGYATFEASANSILAMIPPADAKALDAHDAEVRDRALEEAAQLVLNTPFVLVDMHIRQKLDGIVKAIRALKGGSR